MTCWGDILKSSFERARQSILVVAPFIRSSTLARLLEDVDPVVDVSIVTRWRPTDILAGASDLGVFDLCQERKISLHLRNDLHAKLFVIDSDCFIGSANVTDTALGWRQPANLELLIEATQPVFDRDDFVSSLLAGSVKATKAHFDHVSQLVERLSTKPAYVVTEIADDGSTPGLLPPTWVPRIMNPDELYSVYESGDAADVSRTALPGMTEELLQLGVAPGMTESEFRSWVASSISQTPLVENVLERISQVGYINEASMAELMTDIGVDVEACPPRDSLRTLQRWLTFFLQQSYETTPESIMLIRAEQV